MLVIDVTHGTNNRRRPMLDIVTIDGEMSNVDFLYALLEDKTMATFSFVLRKALKELLPLEFRQRIKASVSLITSDRQAPNLQPLHLTLPFSLFVCFVLPFFLSWSTERQLILTDGDEWLIRVIKGACEEPDLFPYAKLRVCAYHLITQKYQDLAAKASSCADKDTVDEMRKLAYSTVNARSKEAVWQAIKQLEHLEATKLQLKKRDGTRVPCEAAREEARRIRVSLVTRLQDYAGPWFQDLPHLGVATTSRGEE